MTSNELIEAGNQHRAEDHPDQALQCYAMAFVQDPNSAAASIRDNDDSDSLDQPGRYNRRR